MPLPRRIRVSRPIRVSWILLAVGGIACSDASAPPNNQTPHAPAFAVVYDPAINQSDTYVADDADFAISNTLSFSTPTYDPVADAQVMSLDLGTRYESQHIEGGYSTDGSTLINEWNYGDQDFVGSAASVHINTNNATVYDAYGNVVPNYDDAALSSYTGSTINTIDANSGACPESHPECNPPMDMSISVGSGAGAMTYSARPSLQYQGENVLVTIPISESRGFRVLKGTSRRATQTLYETTWPVGADHRGRNNARNFRNNHAQHFVTCRA